MGKLRYTVLLCLVFAAFGSSLYAQRYLDNAIRRPDDYRQKIRLGLRAGVNMSDLTSAEGLDVWNGLAYWNLKEEYIGFTDTKPFKMGFNAGLTAQLHLTGNWYTQASIMYTTKGYKISSQQVDITATCNYMQLPVELLYKYPAGDIELVGSLGLFLGVGVNGFTEFIDHYGETDEPRLFHQDLQQPYVNEELGSTNLVGCDYTVHGAKNYWYDKDDSFNTEGNYRIDAGLQIGLGVEWWRFQLMFTYQYSLTYLYNYGYDFSYRYNEAGGKYAGYHNSFEFFNMDKLTSPRQHVLMFTLSYFFDNWNHGLKI
ncbi:MAG: outer membrane beta-barrel protein [Bacteroidales bacterium]|nr:outer membrane beta-barrel protein [Bacteroidales bacterium]